MRLSVLVPLAAAAAFSFAFSASAAVTVTEDAGNLDFFSAVVNQGARTITINETWGVNTLRFVDIKISGFPTGLRSWTVIKTVTNNTGGDFKFFQHELLNSDKSQSDNLDGLSFAQNGSPQIPRTSTVFNQVLVDELDGRDFLNFFDGVLANGQTGTFRYGLTVSNQTDNNPFFIRQSGVVPEPATWAMLITGFGLVGFAMRRRKSAIASVAA
jgi:hypothetical protein